MDFTSTLGEQRYAALVRAAPDTVVGLDFDGTLAPIVDDPEQARIHPDADRVLVDLAAQVLAVAVITGRPARQALDLGGLEEVGNDIGDSGKDLYLFGQYGNERWSSTNRRIVGPRPPSGLASFERELPRSLRRVDASGAFVEDKGLAVAVHTRRLDDPEAAFELLRQVGSGVEGATDREDPLPHAQESHPGAGARFCSPGEAAAHTGVADLEFDAVIEVAQPHVDGGPFPGVFAHVGEGLLRHAIRSETSKGGYRPFRADHLEVDGMPGTR